MATYALQTDFEEYVEGWTTTDAPALERLLQRAELDIDRAAGNWVYETNGLKFGHPLTTNEKHLLAYQVAALKRATCAQAEYRHIMGEDWMRRAQHKSERGPDFGADGKLPRIGPKAAQELSDAGLVMLGGRATSGSVASSRRRYDSFLRATRHDGT